MFERKPKIVTIVVEYCLEIIEALHDLVEPGYIEELRKSEKEILEGKGIPAEKVFKELGI